MKALREELARDQGSPVITIAGQRRLNMTAIRLAPDFNALNLTEEEEEEVYRAEQERYDEWAAEVSAAQSIVFTLPCLSHPQPWMSRAYTLNPKLGSCLPSRAFLIPSRGFVRSIFPFPRPHAVVLAALHSARY